MRGMFVKSWSRNYIDRHGLAWRATRISVRENTVVEVWEAVPVADDEDNTSTDERPRKAARTNNPDTAAEGPDNPNTSVASTG